MPSSSSSTTGPSDLGALYDRVASGRRSSPTTRGSSGGSARPAVGSDTSAHAATQAKRLIRVPPFRPAPIIPARGREGEGKAAARPGCYVPAARRDGDGLDLSSGFAKMTVAFLVNPFSELLPAHELPVSRPPSAISPSCE